jgi:hypothetical protein
MAFICLEKLAACGLRWDATTFAARRGPKMNARESKPVNRNPWINTGETRDSQPLKYRLGFHCSTVPDCARANAIRPCPIPSKNGSGMKTVH